MNNTQRIRLLQGATCDCFLMEAKNPVAVAIQEETSNFNAALESYREAKEDEEKASDVDPVGPPGPIMFMSPNAAFKEVDIGKNAKASVVFMITSTSVQGLGVLIASDCILHYYLSFSFCISPICHFPVRLVLSPNCCHLS